MTCKDCIHSGLCYKENDYDNFPDRCGRFVPDRPKGEWVTTSHKTDLGTFEVNNKICNQCKHSTKYEFPFCPWCGSDMRSKNKFQNLENKFKDLVVFDDQPKRQLENPDCHNNEL